MTKGIRQWLMLAVGLSVLLGLVLSMPDVELLEFAINAGISLLYSLSIGVPATLIFDRVGPRMQGRPALVQWGIYAGVTAVIVLVASLLVGVALVLIGLVEPARLWQVYRNGLLISLAVSAPVTVGAITVSRMHDRIGRSDARAAEARLASLESRVRPHFLFNALNSAIALIPEDPARAEAVLQRLSALLRYSLDASARLVPLGDELRVVTDYLEIERVRFGDRLAYDVDVPGELRALEVPAFAVQTLVENSVKFAVSARKQGARIAIRAARDPDDPRRVVIDVEDDGPGFASKIWRAGHGLDGLRARLDAVYGARANLIAPAESAGARVRIELPA